MGDIKVYIKGLNGIPIDDWGYCAYLGFKSKQVNITFYEDIEEVPATKFNIVIGPIEDTISYWKRIGVEAPEALNVPLSLRAYTERYIVYTTMKGVRNKTEFPFFIKPKKIKAFIPGVVKNEKELNIFFGTLSDDTEVMISGKVNFVSEYRCFIIGGEVKAVCHYLGDPLIFPDGEIIQEMANYYSDCTSVGYSLDVGVLDNGDTVLVECNDGWSLGSYGCDPIIYTNLLTKRWFEITKNAVK